MENVICELCAKGATYDNEGMKQSNFLKFWGKSLTTFLKLILWKMNWELFHLNHSHRVENFLLEPWLCWKIFKVSFVCPSAHLFLYPFVRLSVHLYVHLPVCPSVHLFICLWNYFLRISSLLFSNFMHKVKVH